LSGCDIGRHEGGGLMLWRRQEQVLHLPGMAAARACPYFFRSRRARLVITDDENLFSEQILDKDSLLI